MLIAVFRYRCRHFIATHAPCCPFMSRSFHATPSCYVAPRAARQRVILLICCFSRYAAAYAAPPYFTQAVNEKKNIPEYEAFAIRRLIYFTPPIFISFITTYTLTTLRRYAITLDDDIFADGIMMPLFRLRAHTFARHARDIMHRRVMERCAARRVRRPCVARAAQRGARLMRVRAMLSYAMRAAVRAILRASCAPWRRVTRAALPLFRFCR